MSYDAKKLRNITIENVNVLLKFAAENGKTYYLFEEAFPDWLLKELELNGFTVEQPIYRKFRCNIYGKVSW